MIFNEIFFFWGFFGLVFGSGSFTNRADVRLSTVEMVKKYGYPIETHEITTEDGYMLTMFRIPHGKNGLVANKRPVLLMHGLYGQAENFIVSGMNNASLAYFLADSDYDVWIGNTRGNQHGRKHRSLNPNSQQFWEFSFHEIGMYDLPAMIDKILENTKSNKIAYVGHSQGGTSFYIMNSERPEYQDKISVAALLAPASFMQYFRNPILMPMVRIHRELTRLSERAGIRELPPRGISIPALLHSVCGGKGTLRTFCLTVYHLLVNGGDSGEFNKEMFPLIMRFIPSVSARQPLHYAQHIASGRFSKWDYGPEANLFKYGTVQPPEYNLTNINVPIGIFYSQGDNLVHPKDVEHSCNMLGNCVQKMMIPNPKWTHLDFIFATNGLKMLHKPVLQFLNKYQKR